MVGCIACNPTRHITSHFFDNWRLICDFHRIKRACKRANIIDDGKKVNQTKNPTEFLPKYLDQLTQVYVQLINVHSRVHALIDKAKVWGHLLCTYENTTWLQRRICHNNFNEIIIGHWHELFDVAEHNNFHLLVHTRLYSTCNCLGIWSKME